MTNWLFHADSWISAHVAAYRVDTARTLGLTFAQLQQQQLYDTSVPDG